MASCCQTVPRLSLPLLVLFFSAHVILFHRLLLLSSLPPQIKNLHCLLLPSKSTTESQISIASCPLTARIDTATYQDMISTTNNRVFNLLEKKIEIGGDKHQLRCRQGMGRERTFNPERTTIGDCGHEVGSGTANDLDGDESEHNAPLQAAR